MKDNMLRIVCFISLVGLSACAISKEKKLTKEEKKKERTEKKLANEKERNAPPSQIVTNPTILPETDKNRTYTPPLETK